MNKRQIPSVAFLVVVNALVLFGVTTMGISEPNTLLAAIFLTFLPLLLLSLLLQGVIYRCIRGRSLNEGFRALLYLLPVLLVVTASPFLPLFSPGGGNQKSPLPSPSARYVLEVPIQNSTWTVRILDSEGRKLHEDAASDYHGRLNSYWHWDEEDRVWLFNADTGEVVFWELGEDGWKKERWGYVETREIDRELEPPSQLYPSYIAAR